MAMIEFKASCFSGSAQAGLPLTSPTMAAGGPWLPCPGEGVVLLASDEHGDRPKGYRVPVLRLDHEDAPLMSCGSPNPYHLAVIKSLA